MRVVIMQGKGIPLWKLGYDYGVFPVLKMGILIQKLVWEGHWDLDTSHCKYSIGNLSL